MSKFSLDDYIDVAERITLFKDKYPDGSLQAYSEPTVMEVAGKPFIRYVAAAYRTPDDTRPGIGTAWEPFPGPTQYTRDSELMNAETAAWGRAIVALGIVAHRSIASRQEVQARTGPSGRVSSTDKPTDRQLAALKRLITTNNPSNDVLLEMLKSVDADGVDPRQQGWSKALAKDQVSRLIDLFKAGALPDPNAQDIPTDLPEQPRTPDDKEWDEMLAKQEQS
jgi:hypothetical protein